MLRIVRVCGMAPYCQKSDGLYKMCHQLLRLSYVYVLALFLIFARTISTFRIEVEHSFFAEVVRSINNVIYGASGYLGLANIIYHSSALCGVLNGVLVLKRRFLRDCSVAKFKLYNTIFLSGYVALTLTMKCVLFFDLYWHTGPYDGTMSLSIIVINTFAFFQSIYFMYLVSECHELLLLINEDVRSGNWRDDAKWRFWRQSSSDVTEMAAKVSDVFGLNHVILNCACFLSLMMIPVFTAVDPGFTFNNFYWTYFNLSKLISPLWLSYAATAEVSVNVVQHSAG